MAKFKILYAAGNNENGKIALARFLQAIEGTPCIIKIAAFKKSSPRGISIDWTLDCLYNIFKPDHISLENENFETYFEQIKYYNPDLIISDLEYFTSHIANVLNTTLWQCSSALLNFAVEPKYNLGLFKRYSFLLERNNSIRTQRQINVIDNSNCKFVYSHLGDTISPPILKKPFEWIRPYHQVGKESVPCQHNLVTGLLHNDKKVISMMNKHADSVIFSEFPYEHYQNLWLKDIGHQEEYFCNIRNCRLFVCQGQTSFLADAFYNGKYSVVMTNFQDVECVINSIFSEHLKLSATIYRTEDSLGPFFERSVTSTINPKIQFLHEKIRQLL